MMSTLQYDPRKRPTASKLLKHPFFKSHTISKDVYNYCSGKKLKTVQAKMKGEELESLKIGPNGITIENGEIDNSPFSLNKLKEATGLRSGFDLRKKADIQPPMLVHKPSYKEMEPAEGRRKSLHNYGMPEQSVLLQNKQDYRPNYYRSDKPKEDISEFKSRIKDPIHPYYKENNDVLAAIKMPSLNLDDKVIHRPRIKEDEDRKMKKYGSNYNLAQPALITSNKKEAERKSRKYVMDLGPRRRNEEQDTYKPLDRYDKRVLNVQQSLPELSYKKNYNEFNRYYFPLI